MRTYLFILLALVFFVSGCGKASSPQQVAEINSDGLSVSQADTLLAQPSADNAEQNVPVANIVVNRDSEPLVEANVSLANGIPDSPDATGIQTALKNAGLYQGEVDGKIGPKTKAAIKEFQRNNNLIDDGKVGPKTWSILKTYLQSSPAADTKNN